MTQVAVARALGVNQPEISRLETEGDMQISTLARLVRALGGELEINATCRDWGG